jgi:integrase/recombinase XerD
VIQEISGHNNLEQLQKYLEVKPEQVRGAVAALSMISHVGESNSEGYVGKYGYHDLDSNPPSERSNNIHQQQNG